MESHNFTVKSTSGKFTTLDKEYKKLINEIIQTFDEEIKDRWELYNIIINELIKNGKEKYFQELKYRLTDGENPNQVILDIINRDNDTSNMLFYLKNKIKMFLDEDFYKRFY